MAAALAAAVLLGLAAASVKTDRTEEVADRFDLDPSKRADLQAATAYLYVRYGNAAVFRHLGGEGIDREQAAYAVLQAVRAKPDLLDDAVGGVPNGALDEVRQAIKAAVPDPVTENAEEEGSKDAWRKAGWTDAQITAGLANIRSESVTTPQEHMSPAISSFPPGFQQMLSRVFRQSLALDETAERQVVGDGWIQGTAVIRFELILAIQVAPILVKG